MPYDRTKEDSWGNPLKTISLKRKMELIATPNATDFTTYCSIYAVQATQVTYLPAGNADTDVITENVQQGWSSPTIVRRVTVADPNAIAKLLD